MNEKLTVQISADIKQLQNELKKAGYELKKFDEETNNVPKGFSVINSAAKNMAATIAAAFTVNSIINFGRSVADISAKFQTFEAVLSNTLGSSSAAQLAMKQISEFAAQTPFQVDELTSSFVKLANQGFTPTVNEMRSLGDLASSTGKSFNQLVEAILDAQTGEFERLKEFGIRASAEGDKVKFTFKGVTTEVQKTSEAMREYILSLGNAEGVTGAMSKISNTLGGRMSNLSDNVTNLQKNIGELNSGALVGMVTLLQKAVGYFTELTNKKLIEQKLAISVSINGEESQKIVDDYNKEISRIGEIKDKNKLTEHLKYINTNMQFYQQAMLAETDVFKRDISFAYYNLFKEARKAANGQMKLIESDLQKTNAKLLELAKEQEKKNAFKKLISFKDENIKADPNEIIDLSQLDETKKDITDLQAQTNLLTGNFKEIEQIGGQAFTAIQLPLTQTNELTKEQIANIENMVQLLGGALTSAFDAALINGQNFVEVLIKAIGDLIKRLIAAVATAAILSAALSIFSGGSFTFLSAFQKFLPQLTGFNIGGKSDKIVSPVPTTNSGSVSFEIRGDKLYGVLQNYNQRLNLLA